jgi:SAM-dependent methyltransferase
MSSGEQACAGEAERWQGHIGRAWVEAQALLDNLFRPIEIMLTNAVAAASATDILDVGCGTGPTTLAIARAPGGPRRCVGIDVSDPMIAAARARAEREGAAVQFIRADAQTWDFEPARFDMIVSRFGIMFFDDPVAAFANLRRSARDDARLLFVAWRSAVENPFMTTAERAAAPLLPDIPPRLPDAPGQFALADPRRVHRLLAESGWGAIAVEPIDVPCRLPEKELVGYFTRLGPLGQALSDADESMRARAVETVRPAFDPFVHGDEVRFTAACWAIGARATVR